MTQDMLHILIADDDEGDRRQIRRALQQSGLPCECVETAGIQYALAACEQTAFECAIIDFGAPGQDGLAGITTLHERFPHIAIIMSTGRGDEIIATEAMKRGASDYIPKAHISASSIGRSTKNAVEKVMLGRRIAQQREELENFARVMVHDLKSPVQSVEGFAFLIEESIRDGNPEDCVEYCRRITRAVQRMGVLIDTLHAYTKADERIDFEPVDMSQVMADTLCNLEHLIRKRGARVTHGELPSLPGSAVQLVQLLQNLIGNGIKYSQAEIPSVHVAARRHDGDAWMFTVKDNGIGISEKDREEVFKPFKRLHGVDQYEGTGLGLATCKKIVERHDGGIWCESKAGDGTTFFFTLAGGADR